jgi:hypothetical protein
MQYSSMKFTWKNGFIFLLPPLLWNIAFTSGLSFDRFPGTAPSWLLFLENILRAATFLLPLLLPIRKGKPRYPTGVGLYIAGLLSYFGCWTYLMIRPDDAWAQNFWMQLAPAYTPIIWLLGIALITRSIFYGIVAALFIATHVAEYVVRFQ